jgi:RNA polymerase sigma factor for flagellar operon FliA
MIPRIFFMSSVTQPLTLSVHHDSWIRHQIRDLVLHLHAPVETAELLQVGLIALAQSLAQFDWERPGTESAVELAFAAEARSRIRADMLDEVRQMTHLSRTQRRRWTLVKLAREHVLLRLRIQGEFRDPTAEELAVVTGLSVTEIGVLSRMAQMGPWDPDQGSHHLMELRSLRQPDANQLQRAREDTVFVLERIAPLFLVCPRDHLRILQRHFGVSCRLNGEPLLPAERPDRLAWMRQAVVRLLPQGLDRRAHDGAVNTSSPEELWPRRLSSLLQPVRGAGKSLARQRMA